MTRAIIDGKKLKTLRQKKGLTQFQLAEQIGLSESSCIQKIESKGITSIETLEKFCSFFSVDPEELQIMLPFHHDPLLGHSIFDKLLNQERCLELMNEILPSIDRKGKASKVCLNCLLKKFEKTYGEGKIALLDLLEDLSWMRINGWISYKNKDFFKSPECEITFTFRNPSFKQESHFSFIMAQILSSKQKNRSHVTWNIKQKSKYRLFLYEQGDGAMFDLLGDLAWLKKRGLIYFASDNYIENPTCKIWIGCGLR